jgi:hypothetical protein
MKMSVTGNVYEHLQMRHDIGLGFKIASLTIDQVD